MRWLLLFVDAVFILPGLITSLVSKGHRRIGDMADGLGRVSAGKRRTTPPQKRAPSRRRK